MYFLHVQHNPNLSSYSIIIWALWSSFIVPYKREWNKWECLVYVSVLVVCLLVFEWQRAPLPAGDVALCVFCISAFHMEVQFYPVCVQCCLSLMCAPSVTTSSAHSVKHRGLHKVIFWCLWYKFASVSILYCFMR